MAFNKITVIFKDDKTRTNIFDLKMNVYVDQVAKARGGAAISFTELDRSYAPGVYYAVITDAQLTAWGASNDQTLLAYIYSNFYNITEDQIYTIKSYSNDDVASMLNTILTLCSRLTDSTVGLDAIKAAVNNVGTINSITGTGFDVSTDGLKAVSNKFKSGGQTF